MAIAESKEGLTVSQVLLRAILLGMMLGSQVTIGHLITNLVVVTLGNIVGGVIIIPFIYHNCYLESDKVKTTN